MKRTALWSELVSTVVLASITPVLASASPQAVTVTTGPDVKVILDNDNVPGGTLTPSFDARNQVQNETSVAISPVDPDILAIGMNDYRYVDPALLPKCALFWQAVAVSLDGGATWNNTLIPGFHGDLSPAGLASPLHELGPIAQGADPVVRFDALGNLYLMAVAFHCDTDGPPDPQSLANGASVVYLTKYAYTPGTPAGESTPNFAGDPPSFTYLSTQIVAQSPVGNGLLPGIFPDWRVVFLDKPWMSFDNSLSSPYFGNLHAAWTPFLGEGFSPPVVFSRSTDGGASFSPPRQISQGGPQSVGVGFGPFTAVAPNGSVLVLHAQGAVIPPMDGMARLRVFRSTDGGAHFSNATMAASFVPLPFFAPGLGPRTPTLPQVVFDDTDSDVVYAAYMALAGSPANADVFVVRSTDGGVTWSAPAKVNDDATKKHQFFPTLAVSNGVLHVAWEDLRESSSSNDPLTNDALHVYYACTGIGGFQFPAFSPNVRITDVATNPQCQIAVLASLGDYNEIAARYEPSTGRHVAHVAWADTRNIPASLCAGPVFDPMTGAVNEVGAANIDVYCDTIVLTPGP